MKFDGAPQIKQKPSPSPEAISSPEEKREAIIEQAETKRLDILHSALKRIINEVDEYIPPLAKKAAMSVLGFTVVGNFERGKMALVGKDLSGEKVSNSQRILSGLVVTSSILFYALAGYGTVEGNTDMLQASATTYAVSLPLLIAQMSPKVMATLRAFAKTAEKPDLLHFINHAESLFEKISYEKIHDLADDYQPENIQDLTHA